MATYKIEATIYIDSSRINSKKKVQAEIQEMLDAYYYDNKYDCPDVAILHKEIKRTNQREMMKDCYGI